jgi:hypothetical protein
MMCEIKIEFKWLVFLAGRKSETSFPAKELNVECSRLPASTWCCGSDRMLVQMMMVIVPSTLYQAAEIILT